MPNTPLVSVVIATYNMARYLPGAVQSVLEQSFADLEIHIVDDGSTDETREVLCGLSDSRITCHYQTNSGQAVAKNAGIRASRGEYVAFLDADDMWMPDKLETQLPLFAKSSNTGVVYSPAIYIDAEGRAIPPFNPNRHRGRITGPLLIENFICFPSAIVRMECLRRVGLFDEKLPMSIDYDLWLRISALYDFDFVDRPTVYYRVWPGQMSNRLLARYRCAVDVMTRFLQTHSDLVSRRVIRRAWAHTYVGRGDCWLDSTSSRYHASADYLRALSYVPAYWPAWRGFGRLFFHELRRLRSR